MVTEKLPAMPHTSWAELDVVFVVKMLYFCLHFWNCVDAPQKIAFYQTVLLSISAEGRLIEWVLIPLTKRPSSPVLPSEQTPAWLLCSLRSPQTQKPYSRLMLLLSPESALVTRFSLLLLQTVKVTSFLLIRICHCYQNLFQLLLKRICPYYQILSQLATKLSTLPVFCCY